MNLVIRVEITRVLTKRILYYKNMQNISLGLQSTLLTRFDIINYSIIKCFNVIMRQIGLFSFRLKKPQ